MNNQIKRLFIIICENNVLFASSNLSDFYKKIIIQKIGFKISLSTLRSRFLQDNRISHHYNDKIYYLQKIENDF